MFGFLEHSESVELAKYIGNENESIIIPSEFNGKPVTRIGDDCFFNHPEIVSVSIPDTITSIGNSAFALCRGIKELILPDSINEIGIHAFRDCKGLKKVVLPLNLKVLKSGVFAFCYLREAEVILPEGLEIIEENAFYSGGCTTTIKIPDSVKEIKRGAFCYGPQIITSLPYDKGWYLCWPYSERVILANGEKGEITDVKSLKNNCELLEITAGNKKYQLFYPCVNEKDYVFESSKNQEMMEEEIKNNYGIEEIYQAWMNGLI